MYYLNDLDIRKNEIISDLKRIKYHDLEGMMYRMGLTYDDFIEKLDLK